MPRVSESGGGAGLGLLLCRNLAPLLHETTAVLPPTTPIPYWWLHGLEGPYKDRELPKLDPGSQLRAAVNATQLTPLTPRSGHSTRPSPTPPPSY